MKYVIRDLQFDCRYFNDGMEFNSKEDIRAQLIDYHSIDYTGERPIEDFTLEEILEWGQWEIEEVPYKMKR